MRYDVIDEAGDIVSSFDDLKDAELYIAENNQHKLEIVDTQTVDGGPCPTHGDKPCVPMNLFLSQGGFVKK